MHVLSQTSLIPNRLQHVNTIHTRCSHKFSFIYIIYDAINDMYSHFMDMEINYQMNECFYGVHMK